MSRATSISERLYDPDDFIARYEAIDELERLSLINKELLAALQRLMGETHGLQDALEAVAQARAAITKATGEQT